MANGVEEIGVQFNLLCMDFLKICYSHLFFIILCVFLDDYIAIGADEEELGSQIEEDILCVYMHNC